jgi:hypothetical protein
MTTIVVPFVGSTMVFIMIGFQTVSSPVNRVLVTDDDFVVRCPFFHGVLSEGSEQEPMYTIHPTFRPRETRTP